MTLLAKIQWHRDRILWKAEQYHLLDAYGFAQQAQEVQTALSVFSQPNDILLLAFWKSEGLWTLVTATEVVSRASAERQVNRISLDAIQKLVEIVRPPDGDLKASAEYLELGLPKTRVWVPNGGALFGLMAILKMFPFNTA